MNRWLHGILAASIAGAMLGLVFAVNPQHYGALVAIAGGAMVIALAWVAVLAFRRSGDPEDRSKQESA